MNQIIVEDIKNIIDVVFIFYYENIENRKYNTEGKTDASFTRYQERWWSHLCAEGIQNFYTFPLKNNY